MLIVGRLQAQRQLLNSANRAMPSLRRHHCSCCHVGAQAVGNHPRDAIDLSGYAAVVCILTQQLQALTCTVWEGGEGGRAQPWGNKAPRKRT